MLAFLLVPAAAALTLPRVDDAAITVDGRADEAAWAQALELPDPAPYQPSSDTEPVGSMRTLVLCDGDALYLHFAVVDPQPELVRAGLGRRDSRDDDAVGILLDPAANGRRAWLLAANPIGVQWDALHLPGQREDEYSWDAAWRSAGHRTPTGYEVELAVPWAAVGVAGTVEEIGLVVFREVTRRGQRYAWPKVDTNTEPLLAAAHLEGPGTVSRRVGIELYPELTASFGEPFPDSPRPDWNGLSPGLTARYSPDHGLTAVATINPDFSQLESDAAQIDVNQRYALQYEEKRAFFLEGADWFQHPITNMVYTRSMNTPLYGVRAAGEIGRLGLAGLHTLDLAPPPSVSEGGGWSRDDLDGHPALATVARARLGLGGESYLGLLGSDRTILGTSLWNRVVALDAVWRVEKRAALSAAAAGTATTLADQPAPLSGGAGQVAFLWSGEDLYWSTRALAYSPGFRQENGFVYRADSLGGLTEAHYNLHTGSAAVPVISLEPLDVWAYWRFDGSARERAWDPSAWVRFGDGSFLKLDGRLATEEFEGVLVDYANAELYGSTSAGDWLRLELGGVVGTSPYYDPADPRAGDLVEAWAEVELQPAAAVSFALAPELSRMTEGGEVLYTAFTGRARGEVFVTPTVWVRLVGERSEGRGEDPSWRVEPLLGWEPNPGRAAYLGGAYAVDGEASWQVFGKLAWRLGV